MSIQNSVRVSGSPSIRIESTSVLSGVVIPNRWNVRLCARSDLLNASVVVGDGVCCDVVGHSEGFVFCVVCAVSVSVFGDAVWVSSSSSSISVWSLVLSVAVTSSLTWIVGSVGMARVYCVSCAAMNVVVIGGTGVFGAVVVEVLLVWGMSVYLPIHESVLLEYLLWCDRVQAMLCVSLEDEAVVVCYYAVLLSLWASVYLVGGFGMVSVTETSFVDFEK